MQDPSKSQWVCPSFKKIWSQSQPRDRWRSGILCVSLWRWTQWHSKCSCHFQLSPGSLCKNWRWPLLPPKAGRSMPSILLHYQEDVFPPLRNRPRLQGNVLPLYGQKAGTALYWLSRQTDIVSVCPLQILSTPFPTRSDMTEFKIKKEHPNFYPKLNKSKCSLQGIPVMIFRFCFLSGCIFFCDPLFIGSQFFTSL